MSSFAVYASKEIHVGKLHDLSNIPRFSQGLNFFQIWQIGGGQEGTVVTGLGCGVRQTSAQILPLPRARCVT